MKVTIQATEFTHGAIKRVEDLGGLAVRVYHSPACLRQLLRPEVTKIHPSLPQPQFKPPMTFNERVKHSLLENRGYLHPEIRAKLAIVDPSFEQRYMMVDPLEPLDKPTFDYRSILHQSEFQNIKPSD